MRDPKRMIVNGARHRADYKCRRGQHTLRFYDAWEEWISGTRYYRVERATCQTCGRIEEYTTLVDAEDQGRLAI